MVVSGIYEIRNTLDGKVYIGSSKNIKKRLWTHRNSLLRGKHYSKHLQAAWNKHGEDAFIFKPIVCCEQKDLIFYEQSIVDGYKANNPQYGYNKLLFVDSPKGMKFSAERLELHKRVLPRGKDHHCFGRAWVSEAGKIAAALARRKPLTEETKRRISKALFGKKMPEGFSERMRSIRLGTSLDAATKEKMRLAKFSMNHEKAALVREEFALGNSTVSALSIKFGASKKCIRSVVSGKSWM